jgi:hypothetical protein
VAEAQPLAFVGNGTEQLHPHAGPQRRPDRVAADAGHRGEQRGVELAAQHSGGLQDPCRGRLRGDEPLSGPGRVGRRHRRRGARVEPPGPAVMRQRRVGE